MANGSISTDSSRQVTCTGTESICAGDDTKTNAATCVHNYVLTVTCSEVSGVTYIRVQSNSLPNHCWTSTFLQNVVQYQTFDFEVIWNMNVYGTLNYSTTDFDSQSSTENILCDLQRTASSNMLTTLNYTEPTSRRLLQPPSGPPPDGSSGPPTDGSAPPPSGGDSSGGSVSSMDTMSGIAITGGAIFNGLAGGNVDAIESELDTMDQCLAHASPTGQQHYHGLTPCAQSSASMTSSTVKPGYCYDTTVDCVSNGHVWSR